MSTAKIVSVTSGSGFTNVYTASSIPLGTKLLIQNTTSSPLIVCLYATASDQGFVVQPLEHYVVPAGVLGCFVKTTTGFGGNITFYEGEISSLN